MRKKPKNPVKDEQTPKAQKRRRPYGHVLRSGGWGNDGFTLRPSFRDYGIPDVRTDDIGFRIVRNTPKDEK